MRTPRMGQQGEPIVVTRDQVDLSVMAGLPLSFRPPDRGVVTAASASWIADGAAAALIGDRATAEADGFRPRARFRARVAVGDDPIMQLTGVIPATRRALARAGLSLADMDWIEINDAFAPVVLAWARELQPEIGKVNPWGTSGAGLMAKMLAGLEATGGQFGLQVMCIAMGQATANIIERV